VERHHTHATDSLLAAIGLFAGVGVGQVLSCPGIAEAVGLSGVGLAVRGSWRALLLGLGIGLASSWVHPGGGLPSAVDTTRPVTVVAHRIGSVRYFDGRPHCRVRVEILRQGAQVHSSPVVLRLTLPKTTEAPGRRWRMRGYLRRSSPPANGVGASAGEWRLHVKSWRLASIREALDWKSRRQDAVESLRTSIARAIRRAGGGSRGAALAQALTLGDTSAIAEGDLRALRRVGLAHLMALSGLHLGLLAAWTALIARRAPRPWRLLLVGGVTLVYVALGGGTASLVRAWWMVAGVGVAVQSRRPARSLHVLLWTGAMLALADPGAVREVAFQLTFLATGGVLLGVRFLAPALVRLPRSLALALAATVGAQLATLPVALGTFHWVPLWGWLWNLLLVPVAALAVPLSLLWTIAAVVVGPLAGPATGVLDLLASLILSPAAVPSGVAGGLPAMAGPREIGLASSLLLLLVWRPRLLVPALLAGAVAASVGPAARLDGPVSLHCLDVGQGDAMLLRDGERALLVDGGGWRGRGVAGRSLLPAFGRLGVRELDVVVVSHGDRDHCGGLLELAGYVPIAEVWMAPGTALTGCGRALSLLPGIRVRGLWAGEVKRWSRWTFETLSPRPGDRSTGNDGSLVLRASALGQSVLLTGDISRRVEADLLARLGAGALEATVLKVAHHGSASSSSGDFVDAVAPRLAIVSAGVGNSFGHPSPQVLERFRSRGVPVLRVDRVGVVEVAWSSPRGRSIRTPAAPR